MTYYIYTARLNGELVYIGKGKGERYRHITSGTSHCYEANKAHFSYPELVTVKIETYFDSEEDCLEAEELMIRTCKPAWNKMLNDDNSISDEARLFRNERISASAKQRKEAGSDDRLAVVVGILNAKKIKAKGVKMSSIYESFSITDRTFRTYKKEFNTQLKEMGLI